MAHATAFADPVLASGTPLERVPFCVIDLETTGDVPGRSRITEIGAVSVRGDERTGTFRSLVDPGVPIPPFVARLTGIDDRTVAGEPPIEAVLPSFVEFARGSVLVAHHAAFDAGFLGESLARHGFEPLTGPVVCTVVLAKLLVRPEVPDLRLTTLAAHFGTRVRPEHRALADAEACAEVFRGLLARGAHGGMRTLGDLSPACLPGTIEPVTTGTGGRGGGARARR